MTLLFLLMIVYQLRVLMISMIKTSTTSLNLCSEEMLYSQRRSLFRLLGILQCLLSWSTNFTSIGIILSLGEISLNMTNMILVKLRIVMNVVIWKRKTRRSEISMLRKKERVSSSWLRQLTNLTLELKLRNFWKSKKNKGRRMRKELSRKIKGWRWKRSRDKRI